MTTLEESTTKVSLEEPLQEFLDEEYRYAYAEDFLNTWIATQIVTLREQRGLSQSKFGELIGTKQPGVSRLENVNHSTWKSETLKKIARALGVRLKITFETFGTLLDEDRNFSREYLKRPSFADDAVFSRAAEEEELATKRLEFAMSSLLVETEATNFKSKEEQGRGIAASASPVGNEMPHGQIVQAARYDGRNGPCGPAGVRVGYTSHQSHMPAGAV
jgi:transcriptional regulator with XRE-family HTH domain